MIIFYAFVGEISPEAKLSSEARFTNLEPLLLRLACPSLAASPCFIARRFRDDSVNIKTSDLSRNLPLTENESLKVTSVFPV